MEHEHENKHQLYGSRQTNVNTHITINSSRIHEEKDEYPFYVGVSFIFRHSIIIYLKKQT